MSKKIHPAKFLNFGELSRQIAKNRSSITRNRIPNIHKEAFNELYEFLETWYNKHYSYEKNKKKS